MTCIRFIHWSSFHCVFQVARSICQVWNSCASWKYNVLERFGSLWASGRCWSVHDGWAWSKYLNELLKKVIVSSTYINRDITHKRMKFLLLKEDSSLLFFSHLDFLLYFYKIYKDVCIVKYHFDSSN